ncbi:pantothenate kinase [Trichothermofontia sp.]
MRGDDGGEEPLRHEGREGTRRGGVALVVGNSRLHWAWLQQGQVRATWDTPHLSAPIAVEALVPRAIAAQGMPRSPLPVWIASVVPAQTALWQAYPAARVLSLTDIPLAGLYPTLGIDRALALLGAGVTYGFPSLVIDAGTALTFTGVNGNHQLVGGAILPGLSLQLRALAQQTAALPIVSPPATLPPRWAQDTETAIASGVIYGILATLHTTVGAWQQQFPHGPICLTGGDGPRLLSYLQAEHPTIAAQLIPDLHLCFQGILALIPDLA